MTRDLASNATPLHYLEVGAGSGALTQQLIKKLKKGDCLTLVEKDPIFCAQLQRKFGDLPGVKIVQESIIDHQTTGYDAILSSLPHNAFPSALIEQIFLKYRTLIKAGGKLSFFEYMGLGKIGKLENSFIQHYCIKIEPIWWNFPPARVFHCKL